MPSEMAYKVIQFALWTAPSNPWNREFCSTMSTSAHTPNNTAPTNNGQPSTLARKWRWAYRKVRTMDCGRSTAIWRATRFALTGDTGRFISSRGWSKLKESSD